MSSHTSALPVPSTAQAAARTIAQWITDGRYPSGERLPSQRELTQQLGISRTSLREALSVLQGQGLLATRPGKGVYVSSKARKEASAEINTNAAASPTTAAAGFREAPRQWHFTHTLADIYQLRFVLEGFVCQLAAQATHTEDVMQLRAYLEQMRQCLQEGNVIEASRLDFDFHMHIVTLAGNQVIADIFRGIGDAILESQVLPFYRRGSWQATIQEHAAIIDALEHAASEQAGQAVQQHVRNVARRAGVHFPEGHH